MAVVQYYDGGTKRNLLRPTFVYDISQWKMDGKKIKLLLQHFGEQTQAKRLVFIEKYASKHVYKFRKLK